MRPNAAAKAARRLADQQTRQVTASAGARAVVATVTSITPGAAVGGLPLVHVTWRGEQTTAAGYAAGYQPVLNQRVKCSLFDQQLFIDYAIVGQPVQPQEGI